MSREPSPFSLCRTAIATLMILVNGSNALLGQQPEEAVPAEVVRTSIPKSPKPGDFYGKNPSGWMAMHQKLARRAAEGGIGVAFFGDSITQGWSRHSDLWTSAFGAHAPANFGIGGDTIENVLWRIENGELVEPFPRAIVLMIGVNSVFKSWNQGLGAADLADGIKNLCEIIHHRAPGSKILVLSILPTGAPDEPNRKRINQINTHLAALTGDHLSFLDVGASFTNPDGSLKSELYEKDRLHLSRAGYEALAAALEPAVNKLVP